MLYFICPPDVLVSVIVLWLILMCIWDKNRCRKSNSIAKISATPKLKAYIPSLLLSSWGGEGWFSGGQFLDLKKMCIGFPGQSTFRYLRACKKCCVQKNW